MSRSLFAMFTSTSRFMMNEAAVPPDATKPIVAIAQMTTTNDRPQNLAVCGNLVKQAKARGACMICLPEAFSYIGEKWQDTVAAGEALDKEDGVIKQMSSLARDHKIWLSCGGFNEKVPNEDRVYNSHLIIDDTGKTCAVYRKIHLFDVHVPNGPVMLESRYTSPGESIVSVPDTPVGAIGLSTCYDVRFPELYMKLVDLGAQILLVPSAFTVPTGRAHWETLLRARAIESQCYVFAAAQVGHNNAKRESYGHAIAIDPWGKVLADAGQDSPTIICAEIDLDFIAQIRTKIPIQKHRRADIFSSKI